MSHPHENSIKAASHKYKTVTQELLDSGALDLKPTTAPYSGNSQLLKDYRDALVDAFNLGNDIKTAYLIVPPKAIISYLNQQITIGLTVS